MRQATTSADHIDFGQGRYSANLLGTIRSHLEGLQGYEVMALELVQNADDAAAGSIVFEFREDALYVRNSEIFSRCDNVLASECRLDTNIANSDTCDFHRITRVASGGKLRHPENIGRFGIGFVSVYQITDYPEIASNGIRLTLFPDQESFNATDAPEIQGTEFRLPWATDGNSQTRRALSASPLTSSDIASLPDTVARILGESLLFLRHVTRAEVRKDGKSVSSYAVTRDDGPGRLKVHVRPADQSSNWCVLQADAGERTSQLCERFGTLADLKRNTGVTVAIPVDQGTEFVGRFFAYLPTEQQHGLSAHINADFFPKPDRKAIVLDGGQHQQAWNAALIECAAATLAENLVALREPLGPVQIWTLIHEAYNNSERATSGSTHPEISAFWKSIKTALERNPAIAMDTSGIWSPASELLHSPTEFETEEVRALRQIGIKLIHPCLADYTDILLIAGVSPLDARSLSAALQEAHVLEELMEGGRVPTQYRRSLLEPLWRAMDKFLARPKSANRSILTSAPLFLTHDHRLTRFDEGRRRPEKVSLERLTKWFPSLPLPHRSLEENAHTLALANELEPELVVSDLKAACRLGDSATLTSAAKPTDLRVFYRLIRDLMVGRDREAGPETLSALAALHIFRAGQGFVAAQSAFLPGDFDDPIGVVSLLVKECYDAVTQEFLRDSLGVDRQSLENYVTTQLPSFFKNAPPIGSYKKLLTVLAKHSSSLLDSSILKDTLLQLRMVPTRDGGWSAPNRTYKHGEELERLLGFAPEWWLDETRTPGGRTTDAFLLDLGIRDGPCAEHLLLAMTELAEKEPTLEAQKRAESLFYVICDNFARWEREAGVDLEWLEMYKSDAIFPADGISDEWFCGESLYGPYRSAAFTSQARFLPFRNTQRLVPKALKFFGINSEPTTDLVIAHLRHCVAEGTAVSPLAYQILNERANDQAGGALLAQFQNEPCVWSEADRRYVEPNRLFWTAPRLGRFGAQVPRQAEEYRKFLSAIGVAEQPTPNQYIGIVKEIANEYRDGQLLADDDAAVVRSCLRAIAAALGDEDADFREDVSSLLDCPCILSVANRLARAHEVAVKDSDWHAAPFGDDIDTMLAPDEPDLRPLYEHLDVALVSEVVTQTADQVTEQRCRPEMSRLFSERAPLFVRMLHDQPVSDRRNLLLKLRELTVAECDVLRARHRWSLGGNEFTSDAQDAMAVFEASGPRLYVQGSGKAPGWAEALRSIFHVLLPHVGGRELPKLVFIGKRLITARSAEEAEADLDDAGIPVLADTWDSTELPPVSEVLDAFAGVEEAPYHGAEGHLPEVTGENSHTRSGQEAKPPVSMGKGAGRATPIPAALRAPEDTVTSGDRRTGRAEPTSGSNSLGNIRKGGNGPDRPGQSAARARSTTAAAAQRRNRLRSYVRPRGLQGSKSDLATHDSRHRYDVEEAARAIVSKFEEGRGRKTEQMPPMHPAYDIKSFDQEGNVARLIEVKGIDGEWVELGVGLKKRQFSEAWTERDGYWLYVVEFARDPERARVYPIQSPAEKVDEFFFDQNWRDVAESGTDDLRSAFQPGAHIRHRKFGDGIIRHRTERGLGVELVIDFKFGGAKALALNLSQMELVTSQEALDGDVLS